MRTLPPTVSSSEGNSIGGVDLNKKRKLQDESGSPDMSTPKQRFRIATTFVGQGMMMIRGDSLEEPIFREEILNELDQPQESEKDSNSFIGAFDNSMSSDAKDSDENSITLTIDHNQPSTSLNSYSNEAVRTHLYSLESRCMKEVSADLKDTLQFDPGDEVMERMNSGFGLDHAITELEDEDEADAETETMILHSNDAAPHPFILSSGRWNLGEGAPLGARRLTIDQEFEQYFSSLLL